MKQRISQVNGLFLFMVVVPYLIGLLPIQGLITNPLYNILLAQLIRFIPAVIFMVIQKYQFKSDLKFHKIKISSVFLLILFALCFIGKAGYSIYENSKVTSSLDAYLMTPLMNLISVISMLFGRNVMNTTMNNLTSMYPLVICVLVVGILPAFMEETIYRGVYLNEYGRENKRWAIFLSAFLFGVLHQNFNQFTYAFAMGIIFALVVEATGSILGSMVIHFVINTTSVINLFVYPKLLKVLEEFYGSDQFNAAEILENSMAQSTDRVILLTTAIQSMLPAIICSILAFFVFRLIAKREGRYEEVKRIFTSNQPRNKVSDFISTPLILGIAICGIEIIASML